MKIIEVSQSYAPLLSALHRESFGQGFWDTQAMLSMINMPYAYTGLLVGDRDDPCGFIMGQNIKEHGEILTLCVRPNVRQKGLGGLLVRWVIRRAYFEHVQRLFLEVSQNNQAAYHLYLKCGFKHYDTRACYYPDGSDAWLMLKDIIDSDIKTF